MSAETQRGPLELWGGVEYTVNRVGDDFRDQVVLSGHDQREDDLDRFATLGLRALRFPVLWERTAPEGLDRADWRWSDSRLSRARDLGIRPIVGLVHHGSGPRDTSLLDPAFPDRLAQYAHAVAERYPWVTAYTPVNEPLTTARFSALYGLWYPHARTEHDFLRAVLVQCRASILAMRAIRTVNPQASFVQTEDLGRTYSTPLLSYQVNFDNERRWLTFDLLAGRLSPDDRMWRHMRNMGIPEGELSWFRANACPPDIIGINHYVTSNRFLDTDLHRYPADTWGGNGRHEYADVAAVRTMDEPAGVEALLTETWQRYGIPLAVTEAHLGCTREEQMRWLREVWEAASATRASGVDVRAVTAWALLGSFDWDSLLTRRDGHYEPGAFDIRGPSPRLTALGRMIGEIARGTAPSHPLAHGSGWWRSAERFEYGHRGDHRRRRSGPALGVECRTRPIVVIGARGTLGSAIGVQVAVRGLDAHLLSRADLDLGNPLAVASVLGRLQPWAVVNAAGYVNVRTAEVEREACFRLNADGPAILAAECARLGVALVTFSSDLVFDGTSRRPYVEDDPVGPTTVYGASKVEAERRIAQVMPSALIVRTSAFFGPWDAHNLLTCALDELGKGGEYTVPAAVVSPTYVPDLANAALDLLIDAEHGIWHIANPGAVSWLDFIRRGAELSGVDSGRLREASAGDDNESPAVPFTALGSIRGVILPSLEDGLARYTEHRAAQPTRARLPEARPSSGGA